MVGRLSLGPMGFGASVSIVTVYPSGSGSVPVVSVLTLTVPVEGAAMSSPLQERLTLVRSASKMVRRYRGKRIAKPPLMGAVRSERCSFVKLCAQQHPGLSLPYTIGFGRVDEL